MNFFQRIAALFRRSKAQPQPASSGPAPSGPATPPAQVFQIPVAIPQAQPETPPVTIVAPPPRVEPPATQPAGVPPGYTWTTNFGGQWVDAHGQLIGNIDPWLHYNALIAREKNLKEADRLTQAMTYTGAFTLGELSEDDQAYAFWKWSYSPKNEGYSNSQEAMLNAVVKGPRVDAARLINTGEQAHWSPDQVAAYTGKVKGIY